MPGGALAAAAAAAAGAAGAGARGGASAGRALGADCDTPGAAGCACDWGSAAPFVLLQRGLVRVAHIMGGLSTAYDTVQQALTKKVKDGRRTAVALLLARLKQVYACRGNTL